MTSRIVAPYPGVSYALSEQGSGPTVLVLHGGAGPDSVVALARHLSTRHRVFVPTHPGWGDSARPAWFTGIGRLAEMYLELLDDDGADDVVLVGSSIGGWLASEMALRDRGRRISALVLVDGVGIAPVSAPARPADASQTGRGPAASVFDALHAYGGDSLHDESLLARLPRISIPTRVVWGADDRVADLAFGERYAAAIPGADFVVIPDAGHVPFREQPGATFAAIDSFLASVLHTDRPD